MATVLVVEDEPAIRDLISLYLRASGHDVLTDSRGLDGLARIERAEQIDLVILDLMLPDLDGRGVCRRIRAISNVPVIMVTALDDPRDKLDGFGLGADDYVTKPFDPAELVARVSAVLRRSAPASVTAPGSVSLTVGNVELDESAFRIVIDGNLLELRVKEFELLSFLMRHIGQVVARGILLERIWGRQDDDSRTLDVHISRLREHLIRAGATVGIDTVRNLGYRLTVRN